MSLKLATPSLKWVKSHAINSNPFLEGVANFRLQAHFFNDFSTKFGAYHAAFMLNFIKHPNFPFLMDFMAADMDGH